MSNQLYVLWSSLLGWFVVARAALFTTLGMSDVVRAGAFAFVCLADSRKRGLEFQCFVLELADEESIIAIPGTGSQSESGEWIAAEASFEEQDAGDGPKLESVAGWSMPILLRRVVTASLHVATQLTPRSRRMFQNHLGAVQLPERRALMASFYGAEMPDIPTSEPDARSLVHENRQLKLQVQRLSKAKGPAVPAYVSLAVDEGDSSALGQLLKTSMAPKVRASQGKAEAKQRGLAPLLGQSGPSHAGEQGSGLEAAGSGGSGDAVRAQIMLEILRELRHLRFSDRAQVLDDAPDSHALDGVRVLRTLSRMRALRSRVREQPQEIVQEYTKKWEDEMGAAGKPWRWLDVNWQIDWGKFKSMKRCHAMLCHILEQDMVAQSAHQRLAVHAQIIQCLKSLHEFALQGDWRTAWPLTMLPDPVEQSGMAGAEMEMECILASLKTAEDLKERSRHARNKGSMEDHASDDNEEKPARTPKPKKKGGQQQA